MVAGIRIYVLVRLEEFYHTFVCMECGYSERWEDMPGGSEVRI